MRVVGSDIIHNASPENKDLTSASVTNSANVPNLGISGTVVVNAHGAQVDLCLTLRSWETSRKSNRISWCGWSINRSHCFYIKISTFASAAKSRSYCSSGCSRSYYTYRSIRCK
jgi:hypothetical protein